MDVKRLSETPAERIDDDKFETQAHLKDGFTETFDDDRQVFVGEFYFAPGERTTLHEHTIRQILYITGGEGIVAAANERYEVAKGDLVSIPPDLDHWHGAKPESPFRHLAFVVGDTDTGGTLTVEPAAGRRSE